MTDSRQRQAAAGARSGSRVATAASSLRERFIAAVTERLPYKATAIFFALVLWLIVSAEEPTSGPVPVQFDLAMDTSLQLVGTVPNVTAYVVGSRKDLLSLTATPLTLHMRVPEDMPDSLLVVALADVPRTQPSGVEVRVQRFQPDTVRLRFASEARRTLPVRSTLRFRADSGFTINGAQSFEPDSVRVVGPRRRVSMLQAIQTIATELVVRDTAAILVPLDTTDLGVRVTPAQVRVRIPVIPDTTTRDTLGGGGA